MKKILFGVSALLLMASCSGNGSSEKSAEDTASKPDSIATVDTQAKSEKTDTLTVAQNSNQSAEEQTNDSAQYDDLLNQYETAVKQYQKFVKNFNGNYSKQPTYTTKCNKLYGKLNKVKDKLSAEQKKKLKSLKAKYDQAFYSIQG